MQRTKTRYRFLPCLGFFQSPSADSCDPLATTGVLELNPCGLAANSVFNDVIVVDSAPDPYDGDSPYEYMDELDISWTTGELIYDALGRTDLSK